MSSKNETGHAVNLSNFKLLIDKCTGFGTAYNPSTAKLKIADMTALWTAADAAHQQLTAAVQNAKLPINERFKLFEPVDKLVTKTLNYYKSTDASDQLKLNAKSLADKYRGFGAKPKKLADGTPDPKAVSTSHRSYVQKADTIKQLIDLYKSDANYSPNEADIKIATLTNLYGDMKSLNDNIGTIIAPVEASRIARNHALYDENGMIDVAMAAKDYVKGLYGATAPETKTITGLQFKRI